MKRAILAVAALALATPALAAPQATPKIVFNADGSFTMSEAFINEMYCISDTAGETPMDIHAEAIVEGFETDESKAAAKTVNDASATCASKYGWGKDEKNWAELIAENDAIEFYALSLILTDGITDAKLQEAWFSLSMDDRTRLLDSGAFDDTAFEDRVYAALQAKGVEDDEEDLILGSIGLASISFVVYARDNWVRKIKG